MKKRKFWRVRFSLRGCLLMLTATAISCSIWISLFEPTQRQWRAARPLLDMGATVETEPRKEPEWVTWLMPSGWSQNIVAVKFNRNTVTPQSLESLHELPHLKRLYMERAGVEDQHLVEIAKLKTLRRLSLWGNSITDEGASVLAELPSLDIVDLSENKNVTWRTQHSFLASKRTKVLVPHSQCSYDLAGDEIDKLAALGAGVLHAYFEKINDRQISQALSRFRRVCSLAIACDESKITRNGLLALHRCQRLQDIRLTYSKSDCESLVPTLKNVCELWGPMTEQVLYYRDARGSDLQLDFNDKSIVFTIRNGLPNRVGLASLHGLDKASVLHFCGIDASADSNAISLVRSLPGLRHLKFTEFCGLDEQGYSLITQLNSLETLRLIGPAYGSNVNIPTSFFATLACRDTLQHIEIRNCGISREHVWPLLEFPLLSSVEIYEQNFGSEGCKATNWLPQLRKEYTSR